MKRSLGRWLSSHQEKNRWGLPFHWKGGEIVLAAILIFGILSLGSGMIGKWINSTRDSGILPVSLHSISEADYSVDEILPAVPAIGLDIIRDLLGINNPPETGGVPEIAVIIPLTPTPNSNATASGIIPSTVTETSELPKIPTATNIPGSTETSYPQQTATPTRLPIFSITSTPTRTSIPPSATNTQVPSSTPGKIPTKTNTPTVPTSTAIPTQAPTSTPLPAPTNTPFPAPTNTPIPPPSGSPTPRPTRSLEITPTAKYTPGGP